MCSVKRSAVISIFMSLIMVAGAWAFTFTPMVVSIAPSGPNAVVTFRVTNDSAQQTAVAIKVTTRVLDEAGKESNQPADKEFLVFPARVVLPPNTSQNVKVQYRGPAAISSEAAYRVRAEQLPVEFARNTTSGVNILLTYVASLYVTPAKAEHKLRISKVEATTKDGQKGFSITMVNEGTKHALIAEPVITITQSIGQALELKGEASAPADGQNILAKSSRLFFLPWESAVPGAVYEGSFSAEIE